MAIDTAPKRRSAGGVPFLPVGPGVTPDAAKPVAWRQQAAWSYSGIEPGEPVEIDIDNRTGTGAAARNATGTGAASRNLTGTGRAPN